MNTDTAVLLLLAEKHQEVLNLRAEVQQLKVEFRALLSRSESPEVPKN